jgi:hypothetical protein
MSEATAAMERAATRFREVYGSEPDFRDRQDVHWLVEILMEHLLEQVEERAEDDDVE